MSTIVLSAAEYDTGVSSYHRPMLCNVRSREHLEGPTWAVFSAVFNAVTKNG